MSMYGDENEELETEELETIVLTKEEFLNWKDLTDKLCDLVEKQTKADMSFLERAESLCADQKA